MTQRIFDVENEKDMADLWDILPDNAEIIRKSVMGCQVWMKYKKDTGYNLECININWHDKTEITRPIQEANEADIGKLCKFWDNDEDDEEWIACGILTNIINGKYDRDRSVLYDHCRRLTKQEIEDLC